MNGAQTFLESSGTHNGSGHHLCAGFKIAPIGYGPWQVLLDQFHPPSAIAKPPSSETVLGHSVAFRVHGRPGQRYFRQESYAVSPSISFHRGGPTQPQMPVVRAFPQC